MMFDSKCPMCGSIEWKSIEKDDNGINRIIECLKCYVQRRRKQEPLESIQ
jgi:Zn ribbon nucleic-acid-binding protein